jgi:hypothetical protein
MNVPMACTPFPAVGSLFLLGVLIPVHLSVAEKRLPEDKEKIIAITTAYLRLIGAPEIIEIECLGSRFL